MINSFKEYWQSYGRLNAIISSAYFWIAVVITMISYTTWLKSDWEEQFIGVFPSLLGFTLAGYAVWLTLGDKQLRTILVKKVNENNISAFMTINASFIHFIVLQVLAFIGLFILNTNSMSHLVHFIHLESCDLFFNIYKSLATTFNCFVFFLSIYSILSMLAAIFGLFNIAKAIDKLQK